MTTDVTIYSNRIEDMLAVTRHAEALGFDGVWLGEHIVAPVQMTVEHPYSGGWTSNPVVSSDNRFYDIWMLIGAVIAATSRMTVSTGIYLLPLRNPLLTARACLSAQALSGGRFRFGVGTGWMPEEFEALGVPFKERGRRCDEILDVLPRLFAGGVVEHDGPFYPFPKLQMTDKAVSVPVIFGGTSALAIKRAAIRGDGWYGVGIPLEQSVQIRRDIEGMRSEAGLTTAFGFYPRVKGRADRETLERYRAAGFDNVVIGWDVVHPSTSPDMSLKAKLQSLDTVAKAAGL